MMNCEVIRDLLPLYTDGLTSLRTNQLIEEHLSSCPECSAFLEDLRVPIESPPPEDECDKLIKALRKQKRRNRIITIGISVLIPLLILLAWWLHMETHFPVNSTRIDSTNPAFILKEEPRAALTEEEIALAQTLFALPIFQESFPDTGYVQLSPPQLEDILAEAIPENAIVTEILLSCNHVLVDYQQDGTRIMLEFDDGDGTGYVDVISKTVSTPEENGDIKYVYSSIYHTATKETEYERWISYHKWFGFLDAG